jgi:hypothetical protein
MTVDQILHNADNQTSDEAQRDRLKMLAAKVVQAFGAARGDGIRKLIEDDYRELKSRFDIAAAKVRKQTGSL